MALIGEIRQRSWILIVLVGFAMLGFIFMDMFSGDRSILSGRGVSVGEVDGESIDQREFERAYNAIYTGSTGDAFQQREQLFNYMVEDRIVRREARAAGVTVPEDELGDLLHGTRLSSVIQQRFRDPQTGQINRETLNSYRDAENNGTISDPSVVDPSRAKFWFFQKTEVNKQRLQDKLATLVAKAMYTPDWMAEELGKGQNTRVDLAFVKIPYENIPDGDVKLEDADFEAFVKSDGARLRRKEAGRSVAYVAFDVAPTAADTAQIVADLGKAKTEWATAKSDTLFIGRQRGSFPGTYLTDEQTPEAVKGAEVGTIVGPYFDNGAYSITKVVDRKTVADSVRARHILLPAVQSSRSLADSLIRLINSGTNTFAELAQQFSTDPGSAAKGGDLGFAGPGMMVPEFNDLIFYRAKEGELNKVQTQFGVHIVEVTDVKFTKSQSGTRLATVSKSIEPSAETQKAVRQQAARFAQTNRSVDAMRAAADADAALTFTEGILVGPNDFSIGELGPGTPSREIVKYVFNPRDGEVSPLVYAYKAPGAFYDGQYVVAAGTGEVEAGVPDWQSVRGLIEPEVRNRKKAAMVSQAGTSLSAIASRYNVELDTARAVNFGASFVPQLGAEPKVLAKAFSMPTNKVSEPIAGNAGVYVIEPLVRTAPESAGANVAGVRQGQSAQISSSVRNRLGLALRESSEVEDSRQKFY